MKGKICLILSTIIIMIISGVVAYYLSVPDDMIIEAEYKVENERCKLLKQVAIDSVKEGEGIEVDKIPNEDIAYEINITNDDVIFNYYIKNYESFYNATINLSNDYEIINERYSQVEISFKKYKSQYLFDKVLIAIGISSGVCVVYLAVIVFLLQHEIISIKKK